MADRIGEPALADGALPLPVAEAVVEVIAAPRRAWGGLLRQRNFLAGVILLAIVVIPVLLAPVISAVGPDTQNAGASFLGPSMNHLSPLMGTDQFGRSIWARVLYGGRNSIGASVAVVVLGGIVGTFLGLVAGYLGGPVSFLIMRVVDLLLAFPGILLALGVTAILGPSLVNAVIAVAIVAVPLYARIVEGAAREIRNLPYVRASRALGASSRHIIVRHVLPGAMSAVIVQTTIWLGIAMLWIAALGFLGLGVQPPTPEWGQMVSDGQASLTIAWWVAVFPGVFLAIFVVGVSLVGDALRDRLNPAAVGA
jgi:ABC-type dipeptide/oligopeptide/nickel transport system permease subunit